MLRCACVPPRFATDLVLLWGIDLNPIERQISEELISATAAAVAGLCSIARKAHVALANLIAALPSLRREANRAMWSAWHQANLHVGTPGEVACIKNLIQVGLPKVDAVWNGILKSVGINAQLQGVVCHGHPWVNYQNAPRRCELGDFLLVHDHKDSSGSVERRAVIVQAKVFHSSGVLSKSPSRNS